MRVLPRLCNVVAVLAAAALALGACTNATTASAERAIGEPTIEQVVVTPVSTQVAAPPTATPVPRRTLAPTPIAVPEGTACLDYPMPASGPARCEIQVLIAGAGIAAASFFDGPNGSPIDVVFDYLNGDVIDYQISNPTVFGSALALAVTSGVAGDAWVEVQIPTRPVTRAWLATEGWTWTASDGYIQVDVATGRMWAWDGDELIVDGELIQSGNDSRPTPLITTYVDEFVNSAQIPLSFGSGVVSLAAFSQVVSELGGSLPKMSINGTASSVLEPGQTTAGSIRANNEVIDVLLDRLTVGARVDLIDSRLEAE